MHPYGFLDHLDAQAVASARETLWRAQDDLDAIRRRAEEIGPATDWRGRAADGYRRALGTFIDDLGDLSRTIAACDGVLADAQRCLVGWRVAP